MKKSIFISFLLIFITFCSNSYANMFDMQEFELKNGLKVVVVPNHKAPIVKHMVWYNVGSMDEKLGQGGKAHLLEHLLFRGTKLFPTNEFNRLIQENGFDSNAFTSYDYTCFHQTLDVTKLELAMLLEADRMQGLDLNETSFEKERDIVLEERKQVVENNPMGKFREAYNRAFWQEHPYGRPIIGTDEEIKSLNIAEVRSFYDSFYAPNNAILILSGDISISEAKVLAKKYYGNLEAREVAKRPIIENMVDKFSANFDMENENISYPRIYKMYKTHSYNTNKDKIYALYVLSTYLGGGETSKLYKDLVTKQKIATAVSSSYSFTTRSFASFSLSIIPKENISTQIIQKELDLSVIRAIQELDDIELEKVKNKMLSGLVYIRDNPSDAGYIVGSMKSIGMSLEEINSYDENIAKVSLEEVKNVANELLEQSFITGIIRPKTSIKGAN